MPILEKIPVRAVTMLFMMSYLSYTFIEILWFIVYATVIGLVLFAWAMKYKAKHKAEKGTFKYKLIGSTLILGDVYLNFTVCLILFDQLYTPSETSKFGWLVTDRLKWNKKHSKGWRQDLAYVFCRLLNKWDEGHC